MADEIVFLTQPGRPGPFGALMDEYVRAAEDFLRVIETLPEEVYLAQREADDPDCRSPQAIAAHACGAALGYRDYICEARNLHVRDKGRPRLDEVPDPASVRAVLARAIRQTERSLDGLWDADYPTCREFTFRVRWGPEYDPEMMLEHGIVHLLRHRRQIERW